MTKHNQYIIFEDVEITFQGNKTNLNRWLKVNPSKFNRIVHIIKYYKTIKSEKS